MELSQRAIYDERYRESGYDRRSAVRVLTAERNALRRAAARALDTHPTATELSIFDFGHGTGRVTNEFALAYGDDVSDRPLRIVACDVSAVGLRKAADALRSGGFGGEEFEWDDHAEHSYIAGSLRRPAPRGGAAVTVEYVHASEAGGPDALRDQAMRCTGGRRCLMTTSWCSGLSHVPTARGRSDYLAAFDAITEPTGEILIAAPVSGDLVEAQRDWDRRRAAGQADAAGEPGDVLYETELGQMNYLHVFGTDLAESIDAITRTGQASWVEAIRFPADEFADESAEQHNFALVEEFNRRTPGRWTAADYEQVHTAAAMRSGHTRGRAYRPR